MTNPDRATLVVAVALIVLCVLFGLAEDMFFGLIGLASVIGELPL